MKTVGAPSARNAANQTLSFKMLPGKSHPKCLLLVGCLLLTAGLAMAQSKPDFSIPIAAPSEKPSPQSRVITKAQVKAVLDAIDKALVKKDAAAVAANYASNAVITATILERGETFKTRHGRDDYKKTLEAGFKSFDNYTLQRKELAVDIAPDGKTARCASTLIEKYSFDGKMQEAVSKELTSLAIVDGKVLVTEDHCDTSIK